MNNRQRRQTFRAILAKVEKSNSEKLMCRARVANRIAKSVQTARARTSAYRVKHNALVALEGRFPGRVKVSLDPQYGTYFVSVKVSDSRFALHAPASHFERRAA